MKAAIEYAESNGFGRAKVNFKLRDWVFSRQRYWGEPIPMVSCPKCGWVPVPEEELPLVLPQVDSYELTDDGESPISKMTDWVNTKCPKCGEFVMNHRVCKACGYYDGKEILKVESSK